MSIGMKIKNWHCCKSDDRSVTLTKVTLCLTFLGWKMLNTRLCHEYRARPSTCIRTLVTVFQTQVHAFVMIPYARLILNLVLIFYIEEMSTIICKITHSPQVNVI